MGLDWAGQGQAGDKGVEKSCAEEVGSCPEQKAMLMRGDRAGGSCGSCHLGSVAAAG